MVRGRTLIIAVVLVGTVSAAAVAEEAEGRSAGADWERCGYGALSLLAGITSPTPTTNLFGAEADALPGEPIYANGFLANVGVRYCL